MLKFRPFVLTAFAVPVLLSGVVISPVGADEASQEARPAMREDRPDDSRGWLIVSKRSYWPLCYESLDRIQETKALIGKGEPEQIADSLDKCAAWLSLAGSAAMSESGGVSTTADYFQSAADSVREGSSTWTDADLSALVTLGLVSMANSHVLRADAADQNYKPARASKQTENPSAELKAAAKEINAQNIERTIAQYMYDAADAQRHLTVAQTYLAAGAKAGEFSLDEKLTAPVPHFTGTRPSEAVDYVDEELRPRIKMMKKFIAERREELKKQIEDKV